MKNLYKKYQINYKSNAEMKYNIYCNNIVEKNYNKI